jgi:hypothetical protein
MIESHGKVIDEAAPTIVTAQDGADHCPVHHCHETQARVTLEKPAQALE